MCRQYNVPRATFLFASGSCTLFAVVFLQDTFPSSKRPWILASPRELLIRSHLNSPLPWDPKLETSRDISNLGFGTPELFCFNPGPKLLIQQDTSKVQALKAAFGKLPGEAFKVVRENISSPNSFEIPLSCNGPMQKVHTPGLAVPRMTMPEEINLGGLGLLELGILIICWIFIGLQGNCYEWDTDCLSLQPPRTTAASILRFKAT